MSDKEESKPVASPTAAPVEGDTTKIEATFSSADPVEDPKIEKLAIAAPAEEEQSKEAEKPVEPEEANEKEEAKPVNGKHPFNLPSSYICHHSTTYIYFPTIYYITYIDHSTNQQIHLRRPPRPSLPRQRMPTLR